MGIGMYLVREISKHKEKVKKYVGNTLSIFLLLSPLVYIFSALIIYYTVDDNTKILAVLLTLSGFILVSFASIFHSVFLAYSKLEFQSYSIIAQEFIFITSSCIILIYNFEFYFLFYAYAFARSISLLISVFLYNSYIENLSLSFDYFFIKKILKECMPFFLNFILTAIYARGVIVFISYYLGDYSTGLFEVAFLISMKGVICIQIISKSIFPKLSEMHKIGNKIVFSSLTKNILKVSYSISFILFVLIFFGCEILIEIFFDYDSYSQSIDLVKVLCFALFFKIFASVITDLLTSSFKQELRTKAVAFGTFTSIVSLFLLVPSFDLIGAAYSVVLTELVILFFSIKYSDLFIKKLSIKLILINAIIILIVLSIINFINIPYTAIIIVSLIIFSIISYASNSLNFRDLINIKNEI